MLLIKREQFNDKDYQGWQKDKKLKYLLWSMEKKRFFLLKVNF